jgi:UDP-N-acetylmuramoyl-tripeptide--D-alanyl-D-alanine ligase
VIALGWEEIAALDLGRLDGGDDAITGVKADSREVGSGDLFVALNSGVQYVDEARSRGAATLVPDEQEVALAALASLVRSKSSAQVVAIVGSAGKTTTKDILGALCAPHVPTVWAERSMNNEIGLPLTVCRLESETAVLVTEMGMRGLGQVAALCAVARPTVVVVPHVGPEHLELLGTVERVAEANAEAVAALPLGGTAVVPAAGPLDPYLTRDDVKVRRFDPGEIEQLAGATRFAVRGHVVELELPFTQRHLAGNTLAALHAYDALGLPLDRVSEGVANIELSPWRGEERPLPGGGFVVNDAYNANPDSMRAALEHLAERAGARRKVAILGEMAELGEAATAYHRAIGELAGELGVAVLGVGDPSRAYAPVAWAADAAAAAHEARSFVRPGDAVLVKASRAVGLEGIADEITNFARAWSLFS